MNLPEVLERLRAEGHTTATSPPDDPVHSPWYVRTMLGFSGWFAGLLILGFFATLITKFFKQPTLVISTGLLLCTAAAVVYRVRKGDLVEQFALAMSLAGQFMVAAGLGEALGWKERDMAWVLVAFQAALVLVMPNFLHRLLSTMFAATALYFALDRTGTIGVAAGVLAIAFAALWLNEARWRTHRNASMFSAIAWGIAIAVLAWGVPPLVRELASSRLTTRFLEALGYGVGLLFFVAVASAFAPARLRVFALAAAGAIVVAASPAPGIVAAVLVLLAGFRAGSLVLIGFAVAGLLGYLSAYYYQLDQTLLVKAGALVGTGAVLLLLRWILLRVWTPERSS